MAAIVLLHELPLFLRDFDLFLSLVIGLVLQIDNIELSWVTHILFRVLFRQNYMSFFQKLSW